MVESASIAVLLATYNRVETTRKCLTSLLDSNFSQNISLIIFITDDNSPDQTVELLSQEFPNVYFYNSEGNYFWNRGMVNSWHKASEHDPDFYLLLNDDVQMRKDALAEMLFTYSLSRRDSVIIGRTFFGNESNITYGGLMRKSFLHKFNFINAPYNSEKICTFNANCVLIPKHSLSSVGILDEFYTQQFGDIDLGLRFWRNNWDLIQVEKPVAELAKNFPYPHGRVSLRLSDLKYLFTHPKGLPYREVWHFYKKFGGFEIYFYIIFRYFKILSKIFITRNFKN